MGTDNKITGEERNLITGARFAGKILQNISLFLD
jgi:hypothetical protein